MARGRAPNYDLQRETIVARAAELFALRGYPGTSMNEVAQACGVSKPTLYHYYRDKYAMLVAIAEGHVRRLHALIGELDARALPPDDHLRELIRRFVEEYASAQHAHRVLTEDVRFLEGEDRERVLAFERDVVAGVARAVAALRPDLAAARMDKPLSMLLFGMINWMFTWMKPDGVLDYDAMAPIVADLFLGGLPAVRPP
ncbi:TetR/AcrR family transcriptional regulator [uncultured Xylophilus sp.]|uniref:TetR/AcrR family transcriptional regulator n=1 Tax=uncultured Xylophilus sp. TaxID=296832 RepID=UPI0025E71A31|nr:TetR/AcrR family transcriptional regulator [uncultured Xylophilus sp.]